MPITITKVKEDLESLIKDGPLGHPQQKVPLRRAVRALELLLTLQAEKEALKKVQEDTNPLLIRIEKAIDASDAAPVDKLAKLSCIVEVRWAKTASERLKLFRDLWQMCIPTPKPTTESQRAVDSDVLLALAKETLGYVTSPEGQEAA